jgi:response regulator RpfG family c-di-GMP phosphodiesterase
MKEKILLVDDDPNILSSYERTLHGNFQVFTSQSGTEGMSIINKQGPFSVVVSDYRMPIMDGIKFLSKVKIQAPDTIRIMLTGQADLQLAVNAVNEGNIFRFLSKPCSPQLFLSTLTSAVEQYRLVTAEKELLDNTLKGSIKVLVDILSIINPFAFSQALRLRSLAKKLAIRLHVIQPWEIEIAALLSQIGCVTIPSEILSKKYEGEQLMDYENVMYLKHALTGKKLLENIPRMETIAEGIAYQFKYFDGTGFPDDQRKGVEIPLAGRILKAIIDYDNLIANGKPSREAFDIMKKNGKLYDPFIMEALEAEILSTIEGFVVKSLPLKDLLIGMVLADDIKNNSGLVLIPKDFEISEAFKARLLNYASIGTVQEPIKVLELIEKIE